MSCNIREYRSLDLGRGNARMTVTAFVAENASSGVQFTIGNYYCALSEYAVRDLIDTLQKRIMWRDGYTATGEEREDLLYD